MEGELMSRFTLVSLVAGFSVLAASLGLTGCGGVRPLHVVKKDADHAYTIRQWEKATADYSEYIERAPDNNEVRMLLGESQLASGNARQAIETLKIALDVDPLNDRIADNTAEALYQAGEREGLTAFVQRIASERGRVKDYLRIAKYMEQIGHPDEAQTALVAAAKIDQGKSLDVQWALARFYNSRGDTQRHIERLRMAYFLAPENKEVLQAIRDAGEIPGPSFALFPREMDVPAITGASEK
jgi:tetratricopeptide (TPR) repeat protein